MSNLCRVLCYHANVNESKRVRKVAYYGESILFITDTEKKIIHCKVNGKLCK